MLNFMDLARSGDQVTGVHLEMKRLGICPFSVEKLLFPGVAQRAYYVEPFVEGGPL
jgi:hypothetical protein